MWRINRRRPADAQVRFCDSCAEVTTGEQRARRYDDRVRTQVHAWTVPH
ncbi:hypothetical protein K1W54_03205 [Micromonospora sp. CPCC 205371]|nr:hypothetical protein [Micromonospora sp. CPCC 205371]